MYYCEQLRESIIETAYCTFVIRHERNKGWRKKKSVGSRHPARREREEFGDLWTSFLNIADVLQIGLPIAAELSDSASLLRILYSTMRGGCFVAELVTTNNSPALRRISIFRWDERRVSPSSSFHFIFVSSTQCGTVVVVSIATFANATGTGLITDDLRDAVIRQKSRLAANSLPVHGVGGKAPLLTNNAAGCYDDDESAIAAADSLVLHACPPDHQGGWGDCCRIGASKTKDTQNSDISAPPSSSHKWAKDSLFFFFFPRRSFSRLLHLPSFASFVYNL